MREGGEGKGKTEEGGREGYEGGRKREGEWVEGIDVILGKEGNEEK